MGSSYEPSRVQYLRGRNFSGGRPDGPEAVAFPPGNDVQVDMKHRLLGGLAGRGNQDHPVRIKSTINRPPDVVRCAAELSRQASIERPEVLGVGTRNHERMANRGRVEREEREPPLAFGDDLHPRIVPLGDSAKGAGLRYQVRAPSHVRSMRLASASRSF
jgi:hypothetical protein